MPVWSGSGESYLPSLQTASFSLCTHMGRGLWYLCILRAPVLSDQDFTLMTSFNLNLNYLLKDSISRTVTWSHD